jgi:hypothetical protein
MTARSRIRRWKLMAIGVAFAIGSALETGLVVAQWTAKDRDSVVIEAGRGCAASGGGPCRDE